MKKILQRIALCVVVLLIAGIAAGVRYFTHDPNMSTEEGNGYVTDNQGMTYTMVADKEGSTYVVVTDAQGNRYAAEYDGVTVGSTVGNINGEVALDDVPTNYNGPHIEVSNDINKFQGEISTTIVGGENEDVTTTTAPSNAPTKSDVTTTKSDKTDDSEKKPSKPSQSSGKLEAYRIEKYQKIFQSGTYLMKITTSDDSLGSAPVTMAIKNGNMYVDMSVEIDSGSSMDCGMLYLKNKDTIYLIFNDWKKYCKMPESMMGEDMDMGEMMNQVGEGETDIGEITVSEVEIGGEKLILESYTSSTDGSTVNYYFQDDVLVRRDNVYSNGQVDSTFFAVLTTDVPDSYFEIPKGYGYLNLSLLDALM